MEPEEEEDNTDLLQQIQEEEQLCAFYESQLQQLDDQDDTEDTERSTDGPLAKALEEWMERVKSFLAQMDSLKAAILPTDASADDFSLSAVYMRMHAIANEISEKVKAHREMVARTVKYNDHLPGSQLELIPEEKLLFNPLPASIQQMYETICKDILVKLSIDPSTKCSDQEWIDQERKTFIQGELDTLLRIDSEKLAVMQSLHFMMSTFIEKLRSLLAACEGLRDEIVELTHDQLYPPFQMPAEPSLQFPQTMDLQDMETDKLASLVAVNIAQLQSVFETNSILSPKLYEAETRLKQQIQEMTESLQACQSLLPMSRDEAQMKKLLSMESQSRSKPFI